MAKATSLLKAYLGNTIPANGGFIISSFFDTDSAYTIYEITSYVNWGHLQSPEGPSSRPTATGLYPGRTATFIHRFSNPSIVRRKGHSTAFELEVITGKKQERSFRASR